MTEQGATDEPRHGIAAPDGSVFHFLAPPCPRATRSHLSAASAAGGEER